MCRGESDNARCCCANSENIHMGKENRSWRASAFLIFILLLATGSAYCKDPVVIDLITPKDVGNKSLKQITEKENYITRRGQVDFAAKSLVQDSQEIGASMKSTTQFKDAELVVSFFEDKQVRVRVDSESRPRANLLTLRGRRIDSDMATFSLTVADGKYLVTYHDIEAGTMFKVVGEMASGVGQVTEIDLEKLPPVIDVDPLVLPAD
jgi:hypothetical protein